MLFSYFFLFYIFPAQVVILLILHGMFYQVTKYVVLNFYVYFLTNSLYLISIKDEN